jgi:hypothetical protein
MTSRKQLVLHFMSRVCVTRMLPIKYGMEEQFAFILESGPNDARYCLLSALQLCKECQQDSYELFVDLIKAFDTANHDLLFKKYGIPLLEMRCQSLG